MPRKLGCSRPHLHRMEKPDFDVGKHSQIPRPFFSRVCNRLAYVYELPEIEPEQRPVKATHGPLLYVRHDAVRVYLLRHVDHRQSLGLPEQSIALLAVWQRLHAVIQGIKAFIPETSKVL